MSPKHLAGLLAAGVIAVAGRLASRSLEIGGAHPVSEVSLAILAGMAVRHGWPAAWPAIAPGAAFAVRRLLRAGIVLLGLGLPFGAVVAAGAGSLGVILVVVAVAVGFTRWLGRRAGCRDQLATLIAVGTGICGATAIVTAAPVIGASDEDVCYAVAVISLFGTLAIFAYPLVGLAMGLADQQFGAWAGLAVHDTAQVVAAGFAYGEAAGRMATVVKLTRTALLAPLILLLAAAERARRGGQTGPAPGVRSGLVFPWFILGFAALALLRSAGDAALAGTAWAGGWELARQLVGQAARLLIGVAMAGVGLSTGLEGFRAAGPRPLACGLAASVVVGLVALGLVWLMRF